MRSPSWSRGARTQGWRSYGGGRFFEGSVLVEDTIHTTLAAAGYAPTARWRGDWALGSGRAEWWIDVTGNGYHLPQPQASRRPYIEASALWGGRQVLRHDGDVGPHGFRGTPELHEVLSAAATIDLYVVRRNRVDPTTPSGRGALWHLGGGGTFLPDYDGWMVESALRDGPLALAAFELPTAPAVYNVRLNKATGAYSVHENNRELGSDAAAVFGLPSAQDLSIGHDLQGCGHDGEIGQMLLFCGPALLPTAQRRALIRELAYYYDAPLSVLDLENVIAFYRGDQYVDDGAGKVVQWTDLSGNGRHLASTLAGQRPSAVASHASFGGRPIVQFAAGHSTIGPSITHGAYTLLTAHRNLANFGMLYNLGVDQYQQVLRMSGNTYSRRAGTGAVPTLSGRYAPGAAAGVKRYFAAAVGDAAGDNQQYVDSVPLVMSDEQGGTPGSHQRTGEICLLRILGNTAAYAQGVELAEWGLVGRRLTEPEIRAVYRGQQVRYG